MNTTQAQLLPLRAMARVAHVPASWLRVQAEAGRVPSLQAGSRLLFDARATLDALVALARRVPQTGGAS
jgi:hypothetical protein